MQKSIYTDEYALFLRLLRQAREAASLTQVQLAERIGQSQSFVSKVEVGDRRVDVIQLRTILHALGTSGIHLGLRETIEKQRERAIMAHLDQGCAAGAQQGARNRDALVLQTSSVDL
jgi:transcriptional regulator with XRE-family HTH domain